METTNYCNLKCSFCNRDEVIGPLRHQSPFVFKSILEKIKDHPVREAKLMGMGEPFLHPEFNRITRYFKEYFPYAFVISATNCQYDLTRMPWFEDSLKNIDLLYLSIDGYKDNYERDRYPSKWTKLISFLEEMKNINRHGCSIVCNYVVNPDNVYDIQRIYDEIIVPYEIDDIRLNIAQSWSPTENIHSGYTTEQLNYIRDNWQHAVKGNSQWDFDQCFWVKKGLYTTVEGRVLTCCMNTAAESHGNILTQPIELIHTSHSFTEIKDGCLSKNPTDHCKNCSYNDLKPILSYLDV